MVLRHQERAAPQAPEADRAHLSFQAKATQVKPFLSCGLPDRSSELQACEWFGSSRADPTFPVISHLSELDPPAPVLVGAADDWAQPPGDPRGGIPSGPPVNSKRAAMRSRRSRRGETITASGSGASPTPAGTPCCAASTRTLHKRSRRGKKAGSRSGQQRVAKYRALWASGQSGTMNRPEPPWTRQTSPRRITHQARFERATSVTKCS